MDNTNAQNVFVCGSGHSGTTLLDMILGGHSQISALGEVGVLPFNLSGNTDADRCACGNFVPNCPFWGAVDAVLRSYCGLSQSELSKLCLVDPMQTERRQGDGHFPPRTGGGKRAKAGYIRNIALLLGSRLVLDLGSNINSRARMWRSIYQDRNRLYDAVRKAHGTPIVVDSTKNPGYLRGIWWYRSAPMKFIEVVRDGRAVCWSRVRRERCSIENAINIWLAEYWKRRTALRGIPPHARIVVRYEDLATNPEAEISRISRFFGVPPETDAMLKFREFRHNLGGNPMRYRERHEQIRLDERWRMEMPKAQREIFDRKAGWLNRRYKYV